MQACGRGASLVFGADPVPDQLSHQVAYRSQVADLLKGVRDPADQCV
jgi:hypothetical protein